MTSNSLNLPTIHIGLLIIGYSIFILSRNLKDIKKGKCSSCSSCSSKGACPSSKITPVNIEAIKNK